MAESLLPTFQAAPPTADDLTITPEAVVELRRQVEKQYGPGSAGGVIRISVKGGGCSGFSYVVGFDTRRDEFDRVYEFDGLTVVVDEKSMFYLKGIRLSWEGDMFSRKFVWTNPNAKATCGCGTSFAV